MANRPKIMSIVGTRPQIIKEAVLSPHLRKIGEEVLIHSGQHYDANMSGNFFKELDIPKPDYTLGVGCDDPLFRLSSMIDRLRNVTLWEKPDMVVVYGDCDTTLAGALVARRLGIPLAHVEAGVRTYDRSPEESNRIAVDHMSDLLFAPTDYTCGGLLVERARGVVFQSGDLMFDSFQQHYTGYCRRPVGQKRQVFCTIHREENTVPHVLGAIVGALDAIGDYDIDFAVHPRTAKAISKQELDCGFPLGEPRSYTETLATLSCSDLVITDSGGLQREAYFAHVPCLVIGEKLAWPELAHWNRLVPPDTEQIVRVVGEWPWQDAPRIERLFGDGRAGEYIAEQIKRFLDGREIG